MAWARRLKILDAAAARSMIAVAERTFYADRTWDVVIAPLPAAVRKRFTAWLARERPSRKADDARMLLSLLATAGRLIDEGMPARRSRAAPVPRTWAFAHALRLAARPR